MLTSKISWATRQLPTLSDQDPGGAGVSTGNKTVAAAVQADAKDVAGLDVAPQMEGTAMGHPVAWWGAILVILIAVKYMAEAGKDAQFANLKVGFWNLMVITLSSVVGLIFLKWILGKYRIPGLSDVILAA